MSVFDRPFYLGLFKPLYFMGCRICRIYLICLEGISRDVADLHVRYIAEGWHNVLAYVCEMHHAVLAVSSVFTWQPKTTYIFRAQVRVERYIYSHTGIPGFAIGFCFVLSHQRTCEAEGLYCQLQSLQEILSTRVWRLCGMLDGIL